VFEVVLSESAKADIRNIVIWWSENRSKVEAETRYVAIMEKVYSLEHMPLRCPIARESEQLELKFATFFS